jgi:shikimate kinase
VAKILLLLLDERSVHGLTCAVFLRSKSRGQIKDHGFLVFKGRGLDAAALFVFRGIRVNIVLIGYRCSGKTTVGKILAESLGFNLMDTDRLIEIATGISIHALIAEKGWLHFRDAERKIIKQLSDMDNQVIATGGGVVMESKNIRDLKKKGWIIWLKAAAEVLKKRLEAAEKLGQIRPSLTGTDAMDEIIPVLTLREPLYAQAGDMVIDTSGYSVAEVAAKVLKNLPHKFIIRKG